MLASWLLLAGGAFAAVGAFAWSHVDSQHRVLEREPTNCIAPKAPSATAAVPGAAQPDGLTSHTAVIILRPRQPGDVCTGGGSRVVGTYATPNHAPGAGLVALGIALAVVGVTILRREPHPSPVV